MLPCHKKSCLHSNTLDLGMQLDSVVEKSLENKIILDLKVT